MGGVAWTEEEDHLLKRCIEQYGEGKWHRVPLLAGLNRCRKSCRLRWLNYLRPNIKRGSFTEEEVDLIIQLHKLLGNRWSLIAGRLPGRTANDVKNYWNCHLSKKLDTQRADGDDNLYEDQSSLGVKPNVEILRPQPGNYFGTSAGSAVQQLPPTINIEAADPVSFLQPPTSALPEEILTSSSIPPMMLHADDDDDDHPHHYGNNINSFHGGNNVLGDLTMDFEFDEAGGMVPSSSSKWDWDDSLMLDMDLWGDSS